MIRHSPELSVIIPARNEAKLLPGCLSSLKNQKTKVRYEVLVVDTRSIDRTRDIAKSFGVRIISEPKKGKVYAFRKGAQSAKGKILCFTEADCIVPPHWVQTISDYFKNNNGVVAISGTYTFHSSTWFYNLLARIAHPLGLWVYRLLYKTASLRGSNFAIRRDAFFATGGFPENYLEFYDVELGRRAARFGQIHHIAQLQIQTSDRRIRGRMIKFMKEFIPTFTHNILLNKPLPSQTYQHIR